MCFFMGNYNAFSKTPIKTLEMLFLCMNSTTKEFNMFTLEQCKRIITSTTKKILTDPTETGYGRGDTRQKKGCKHFVGKLLQVPLTVK